VGDGRYVALTGNQTVAGTKTFSSQIVGSAGAEITGNAIITGNLGVGVTPARKLHVSDDQVRIDRTQNDTSSRTHLQFVRGSGAGSTALINTVGGGANDVTRLRFNVAGGDRVDISSTGLEVTGAITATAGITPATAVTVAGLPSAAASTGLIHRVTNEATYGNTLVTSDGTSWLNVLDGTTTTAA
jgi:hypothetical protein